MAVVVARTLINAARAAALALPETERGAWEHYHAGVVLGLASTPADYPAALRHFNGAIAADPRFARAHGAAAWAKACLNYRDQETQRLEALQQAHRGIALGGDDADALAIGAWAAVHVALDFDAALRAVAQAVRANPLSRVAWSTSGWVQTMAGGHSTPLQHFDKAEHCNPDDADLDNVDGGRAFCLWQAGRFPEAMGYADRSIERLPGHVGAHAVAIAAAVALGETTAARGYARRFLATFPDGAQTGALMSIPLRDAERKAALIAAVQDACAIANG